MKKTFADFDANSADDRRGVFLQIAQDRGILPINAEKDYWVCHVLNVVMRHKDGEPGRVFKGGTSLAKGYKIIERFSEDIDIVLVRDDLIADTGDLAVDNASGLSERQRRTRFSKLRKAARDYLHGALFRSLQEALPGRCSIAVSDKDKLGMTLLVGYETLFPVGGDALYNDPLIKIEANIKAADFPTVKKHVSPYLADILPSEEWALTIRNVTMISAERTFWEKILAVHARHCRFRDEGTSVFDAKKVSRHYYDLAMLMNSPVGRRALKNRQLLADAREHDAVVYFDEPWRKPDEAKPGTIRVYPQERIMDALRGDFDAMQGMVHGKKVTFEWVMDQVKAIDWDLNGVLFPEQLAKGRTVKTKEAPLPKTQPERFVEAAREIGTDEDSEVFKERLKKLVKAPPPKTTQKRSGKTKK